MTRTADGDPERWAEILTANAGPVADQLDDWAAEAQAMARELRDAARSGDATGPVRLRETLRFGAAGRARIREPDTPRP